MRIGDQRRSDNFEDRGQGRGGGGRIGGQGLFNIVRLLGVKGTVIVGIIGAGVYFIAPQSLKSTLLQAVLGGNGQGEIQSGGTSACSVSESNAKACDFSRVVLASTEDVWAERFSQGALPGEASGQYANPTLVVFSDQVSTGGCGNATSGSGPFYCPGDG